MFLHNTKESISRGLDLSGQLQLLFSDTSAEKRDLMESRFGSMTAMQVLVRVNGG